MDLLRRKAQVDSEGLLAKLTPVFGDLVGRRIRDSRDEMAEALGPVMGEAIRVQIRDSRDDMVEALAPVIGETVQTAVIQITDNGQGMDEEQQAAAFDLYYRTDDADNYDITGRGLGLYIVRMLTEAHGGHVDLTSKPDL